MKETRHSRWKKFWFQRQTRFGLLSLGLILFFSMSAEFWSNSRPIFLIRDGHAYFPAFRHYPASEFGVTDSMVIDYRDLINREQAEGKPIRALFAVNPWDPFQQHSAALEAPSRVHWLGTDSLGRDVTARLLYALRVSIIYGLMFWLAAFLIGVTIGALQGYFAGRIDFLTERLKELIEVLPFLSIVILVNGLMRADSFWITWFVVVVFSWVGVASQVRAQMLALRKRGFAEAARATGAHPLRIVFLHLLPNALTPVITLSPFAISGGITTLAVLDYLGFGLSPPTPSLGAMLQEGRVSIQSAPWLLIAPTVALSWTLISINLVGESLRREFD